ncbi:type VI secretion system contractile sheath large subunit [Agaribacterium haliotis]|uniref:type VI secretion system contractile sheath large subunit n=1 Tax=Agaribacterium haliotis TaxID=2013869 RepID=UPI001EFDFC60|nr:type VI secretion system contractile sheath large subunit [Agaribacterium haliotis]
MTDSTTFDIDRPKASLSASGSEGSPPRAFNYGEFLAETDTVQALCTWLLEHYSASSITSKNDIRARVMQSIAAIDSLISEQLNEIIHHPRLQKLEASWRGLWYLAEQIEGTRNIKLKLLDISWAEVSRDISRALEFDQSQLFQKIYSEEYGHAGGEPYGVIIGDYEISHKPDSDYPFDDVSTLEGLAQIAAASFAPFIASASPKLFGLDDHSGLGQPLNFKNIFSQQEYIRWNALRDKADSRFIGLTLPRMLMRRPYRKQGGSYKGVFFKEKLGDAERNFYLWGNACYAFASILIREFNNVGWFGHIRGVPRNQLGGGLLNELCIDYLSDSDMLISKPATDVIITDHVEKELSDQGFVPLSHCYDTEFAAFYNNQSIQRAKSYQDHSSHINARLSSMLQHVLCGSRIAHYIKVMIRDKLGSFVSAMECEDYLRKWLFKYTTGREDLDWEEQARFPLRQAAVQVREHPEKAGAYTCVISIVPHYQIDQMVSELELVTELAQMN